MGRAGWAGLPGAIAGGAPCGGGACCTAARCAAGARPAHPASLLLQEHARSSCRLGLAQTRGGCTHHRSGRARASTIILWGRAEAGRAISEGGVAQQPGGFRDFLNCDLLTPLLAQVASPSSGRHHHRPRFSPLAGATRQRLGRCRFVQRMLAWCTQPHAITMCTAGHAPSCIAHSRLPAGLAAGRHERAGLSSADPASPWWRGGWVDRG
jgi:hypothetical protein